MTAVYARFFRPVAVIVMACGTVSALLLIFLGDPKVAGVDPDVLLYSLVGVLAVLGVVVPALAAVSKASAEPTWRGTIALFLALTANAATLGGGVAGPATNVLLIISIALCLVMSTVGLIGVAERQSRKPPHSRF